jgi:hypothetical protein
MSTRTPLFVGAILAAVLAGCDLYECTAQFRFVRLEATLAASDTSLEATGSASLSVNQFRGSTEQQLFTWFIRAELPRDSVATILLRSGSPADPGDMLFRFPVNGEVQDVLSVNPDDHYDGTIPYGTFFEILRDESTFIEVRRVDPERAELVGELAPDASRDWHDSCN